MGKKSRGSIVIDKTFSHPVGRIYRRSGLSDDDQFQYLKSCIQKLWSMGRHEDLIRYRDRKIDSSDIVRMVDRNEIYDPDSEFLNSSLMETLDEWVHQRFVNKTTLKNRVGFMSNIPTKLGRDDFLVRDIPEVLKGLKKYHLGRSTPEGFSQTRTLIRTFVKENSYDEQNSRLYKDLKRVKDFSQREKREMGLGKNRNPISSPSHLDKLLYRNSIPEDVIEWTWFLCVTGIHRQEVLDGIEPKSGPPAHIYVRGKKTLGRERIVPMILEIPEHPLPSVKKFRYHLKKCGRTPYDLRRTFSIWCLRSGIPQNHIESYMGHVQPRSTTDIYQREDVRNWISEDTQIFNDWIEREKSGMNDVPKPHIPKSSSSEIGINRQHDRLEKIKMEIDRVLLDWYENKHLEKRYRLNREVRCLVEV